MCQTINLVLANLFLIILQQFHFKSEAGKRFWTIIFKQFPFSLSQDAINPQSTNKRKDKVGETQNDVLCIQENILICQLYCSVMGQEQENRITASNIKKIVNYIKGNV